MRVLLLEDNDAHAALIIREVERAGFDPLWTRVDNERDYLDRLEPAPDLVISDFDLPQFDGRRALQHLLDRQIEAPFILVSGAVGEETAVDMMKMGAADYLLKDRLARLGPAIHSAVEKLRLRCDRRRTVAALRESEERFRLMSENIDDVLFFVDPEAGQALYASPAYERIWGRPRETLYADPELGIATVHPDDRHRVQSSVQSLLSIGSAEGDFRIRRPDGEPRWINISAAMVRDSKGTRRRVVGVARDLTAQKGLEAQLRHSQKMETFGQLAGGIAHDFNNILMIAEARLDLLKTECELQDVARVAVGEVVESLQRAGTLTRQLLAFSRKQVLQREQVDLNSVVVDIGRMLGRTLGPGITMTIETQPELPSVIADRGMLEQVVLNLAVNARDAMPEGGKLVISTHALEPGMLGTDVVDAPDRGVCLRVTDTGCGIADTHLLRIFEPYFTTKAVGKGTGLGLATVHGIVKQHGGMARVRSTSGQGTVFEIVLPASEFKGAPAKGHPGVTSDVGGAGGGELVLIIDDELAIRKIVKRMLVNRGYRVLEASSAGEAISTFEARKDFIRVVITDLSMPEMPGMALACRLRDLVPDLPVVFMSGYGAQLSDGFPEGTRSIFLQKPFNQEALTNAVRSFCVEPAL